MNYDKCKMDVRAAVVLHLCDTVSLCYEVHKERAKRKRVERTCWVRPINMLRKEQGDYDNLIQEMRLTDLPKFFNYTRMSPTRFDHLLSLVGPSLKKKSNREPLPEGMKLMMTLRFLATGDSFASLAFAYRIGNSTCCNAIAETTQAIWDVLSPLVIAEPKEEDYQNTADGFLDKWQLPHCVGAIDGKHCVIQAPIQSGSQFFNYKKSFSIVLLAVCDANYIFTLVDIGAFGSQSDGGILRNSVFGKQLFEDALPLPPPEPLPYGTTAMPFFFAGDEAFGLHTNILRPYPGRGLTEQQRIFNYRLSRGRRVIENAFGILVARWRIFHRVIASLPDRADNIIKATVCLHNYLKKAEANSTHKTYCPNSFFDASSNQQLPEELPNAVLKNLNTFPRRMNSRNSTAAAQHNRRMMTDYVNSPEGSVEWQLQHVRSGTLQL